MIRALDEASFTADQGELSVILGQSGAGKTTALNILGGMDTATSGRVIVGDRDITGLRKRDLVTYRRNDIGFVFQFYNLVPNLTALENVELASQICPDHFDPAETLYKVGLGERMGNFPAQLSGGEQQRVSIARAIAKKPKLLLCDEPTGALDYETGKEVLQLLQDICQTQGMTVMIITHDGDGPKRLVLQQLDERVLHGTSRVSGAAAFRQFFGHGLLPKFRQPTIQLLVAEPTQCCFT